ncbi:valine--tRNA ligase [Lapillicoccus sp.]|uniref:valine--tRNA ligase n=1 Tax=Lapillicoccus sp. TaxID=1909287 RepID=UPI0032642812
MTTISLAPHIPDRPSVDGLEEKWMQVWRENGTYTFDRERALAGGRDAVWAMDTPPPTASGSLHIGHVFGFTEADCIARYKRMAGLEVFYPIGWDDNGLPTEKRVQNYYGVRGDASLPYDPAFVPTQQGGEGRSTKASNQQPISRRNFIELCDILTVKDEVTFEETFRRLGLACDWAISYRTIDERSRSVSQAFFLRNLARAEAYQAEAPGLWDVTFQTAVAQAELEARDYPGAYHRIAFRAADGTPVFIESTRPELLPACVALIAHPDDERYASLFGTTVTSPLFGVEVPVVAHPLAEMDKGAGIAMCCTFGDLTDVQWWRELQLPTRSVITRDGRILPETPTWLTADLARRTFEEMAGKTTFAARTAVVDALRASGDLDGEPTPTQRKANFYERGERPLEIVTSRQWYIRNGGRDETIRAAMIERGRELDFHPAFMRARYENWVGGLNGDWLISRQRFFGVPIPVWYPVLPSGELDHDHPIVPDEAGLPVDPAAETPAGYNDTQRDQPGGFSGDPDVMDTWATSSVTPQIAGGWGVDPQLWEVVFPMDQRPQGHDIIRTWLFGTVVRSHFEHGTLPWRHATINGWILDPDRKKMSKSKGNATTPIDMLVENGTDAVRYWAASARLGMDASLDTAQMKVGRRLAIKVLNASKFALSFGESGEGGDPADAGTPADTGDALAALAAQVTEPLDRAMLASLADVVDLATRANEALDYTRALEVTESFFWSFCDDYLELVKDRAYGSSYGTDATADGVSPSQGAASARAALRLALDVQLRLLAPVVVFATEEVWSWFHEPAAGSIHQAAWPTAAELGPHAAPHTDGGEADVLTAVGEALAGVRKAKSDAKVGMRAEITAMTLVGPASQLDRVRMAEPDLRAAGRIQAMEYAVDDSLPTLTVRDAQIVPPEPRQRG